MVRSPGWPLAVALGLTLFPVPLRSLRPSHVRDAQDDWVHLGVRAVDFRVDHDVIRAAAQGRFRRIRIVVEGGDLELFNVRVTFGDGAVFSPATRVYFKEDSRSRVIDLPGSARIVRRIDFYYRSVVGGGQGKAIVHAYGHR